MTQNLSPCPGPVCGAGLCFVMSVHVPLLFTVYWHWLRSERMMAGVEWSAVSPECQGHSATPGPIPGRLISLPWPLPPDGNFCQQIFSSKRIIVTCHNNTTLHPSRFLLLRGWRAAELPELPGTWTGPVRAGARHRHGKFRSNLKFDFNCLCSHPDRSFHFLSKWHEHFKSPQS